MNWHHNIYFFFHQEMYTMSKWKCMSGIRQSNNRFLWFRYLQFVRWGGLYWLSGRLFMSKYFWTINIGLSTRIIFNWSPSSKLYFLWFFYFIINFLYPYYPISLLNQEVGFCLVRPSRRPILLCKLENILAWIYSITL